MAEIKKTSARKSRRRSRHAEALESTQKAIPHALWAHKAKAANDPYTMRLDFPDELIIDNFAGGGGTSTGLEAAFGRPVDIAINHDPEALSMHALNHPHTKHLLQSVWDVKPKEVTGNQPVALVWLSPDCFPAGTLVLTRSGYQPIQTVTVGQEVLTHKGRWRCVTETSNARRPLMNIRGHGHPGLKVSPEHPFYVRNSAQSSPEWAPASALKKGLFWATPHAFPKSSVPPVSGRGMDLTPSLMWLAGQYAGNGWTRINEKKGELVLTCGEHKADELRKILISSWPRTSLRAGFNELTWQERKTRTAVQFSTSHRGLVEWLREHFGHLAPNKSVPAWCLGLSRDFRQALLTGYLAADGYKADDFFEVTSVSKALAFSVKALAASLGHTVAVYQRQNTNFIEGRKVNARPGWLLRWRHAVDEAHRQTFRKDHLESLTKLCQ